MKLVMQIKINKHSGIPICSQQS